MYPVTSNKLANQFERGLSDSTGYIVTNKISALTFTNLCVKGKSAKNHNKCKIISTFYYFKYYLSSNYLYLNYKVNDKLYFKLNFLLC